jgi:hypothetical protein
MPVSLLFKNLTTYPNKKQLLRKQMAVDGSVHDKILRSHRSVKSSFSSSLVAVSLSWSYPVVLYLHIPEHSQFYHSPILLFCIYIYLNTVSLSWSYPVVLYLHIPEHSQFIIVLSCCFVPTYTWTQSVYHGPILLFCTYIYLNTVSLS